MQMLLGGGLGALESASTQTEYLFTLCLIFSFFEYLPGIRTPTIRTPYNLRATATSYVLTTLRPFFLME